VRYAKINQLPRHGCAYQKDMSYSRVFLGLERSDKPYDHWITENRTAERTILIVPTHLFVQQKVTPAIV
jgi:hypothetical protein